MAEETFRLPKSSYNELVRIIRAYGSSGGPVSLEELAHTAAMDMTIISSNNAFLASLGIIEGGKAKGATEKGRKLSMALNLQMADEIAENWRELATGNEFLQKMVTAVSIRQGMENSALQAHIAYSAGEPKSARVMAGAGAVVEILKISGFLKEQDGKLVADTRAVQRMSSVSLGATLKEPEKPEKPSDGTIAPNISVPGTTGISIQIQIQCTAAEISELAPKLRTLIKELSRKEDIEPEGQS
jgi:hypothetical protein